MSHVKGRHASVAEVDIERTPRVWPLFGPKRKGKAQHQQKQTEGQTRAEFIDELHCDGCWGWQVSL